MAETAAAEPFSSEQLDDLPSAAEPEPAAGEPVAAVPSTDTLEQPTWLDPADAPKADGDAGAT